MMIARFIFNTAKGSYIIYLAGVIQFHVFIFHTDAWHWTWMEERSDTDVGTVMYMTDSTSAFCTPKHNEHCADCWLHIYWYGPIWLA